MDHLSRDGRDSSSTASGSSSPCEYPPNHPFRRFLSRAHLEALEDSPLAFCEKEIVDHYEVFLNCIYWHTKKGKRITHATTMPQMRMHYLEYLGKSFGQMPRNRLYLEDMKWHEHNGDSDNEESFLEANADKQWDKDTKPSPSKIHAPPPLLGLRKRNTLGPFHSKDQLQKLFPYEDYTLKYKPLHQIAKGSFGSVSLCQSVQDPNIKVAVKMTKLDQIPERIHNIAIELALMETCAHPNVIQHQCSFYWQKAVWSVLEFCNGGAMTSLRKVMLGEPQLRFVMKNLLLGIQHIHRQNVAHRDLKCNNIMLNLRCQVLSNDKLKILYPEIKIGDFGLSCFTQGAREDDQFSMVGSRYWMSPEMIQRVGYGLKTDIYSLGCVMFELLTGKAPYRKKGGLYSLFFHATTGCPPLPNWEKQSYSEGCQGFLAKLVKFDPRERPDATAMLEDPWLNETIEDGSVLEVHLNTAYKIMEFGDKSLLRKPHRG